MSGHDELDRAMPVVVELDSFVFMYGELSVKVTLPEAGDLELEFTASEGAERDLLQLIGRLVNDHLRELGAREIVIVPSELDSDDLDGDE